VFLCGLFSHPIPLGIGYLFPGIVDAIGYEVSGIWFVSFIPYVTRHT